MAVTVTPCSEGGREQTGSDVAVTVTRCSEGESDVSNMAVTVSDVSECE